MSLLTKTTLNDTIAAIATSGGSSSISIVRVSGKEALSIASKITNKNLNSFQPRKAILSSLYDKDNNLIDRGIVIYFKAPNSFTGEDIVEFQCHGGDLISSEILSAVIHHGARLAEPGEFSKRAFLNGKIDMSEAEAIAKLIEAKSVDAARILAKQLKGEVGKFVNDIKEEILHALAYSEVMIDYAEEDIPENITDNLKSKLQHLKSILDKTIKSSERRRGLIEGFSIAFIGKPNVGKSSLLNALLNYDRAIVSDIAGTTRDTIEERIKIGSHIVRIIDTAGIREAKDEIEEIGVLRSLETLKSADIVVALFDISKELDEEDKKILSYIKDIDKNLIVALNKADLEPKMDISIVEEFNPIKISAKGNFEPLMQRLQNILDSYNSDDEIMLISARQIEAVKSCATSIELAITPLENGELEFFSYHLKEAADAIGKITNPYDNEEMLDRMFGEFCLGK